MEVCRRGDGGCRGSPSAMGHRAERTACQTAQSKSLREIIITRVAKGGKDISGVTVYALSYLRNNAYKIASRNDIKIKDGSKGKEIYHSLVISHEYSSNVFVHLIF